ncbi:LysR family transcriptional regulator [Brenneria tiliae]|uniref:LysR family transcriptional regulator n=1 Tax=Brenneria tiliae TaxID=2914984 RepID=UPI002014947F|nr:LysR family transcriptional regulator [Brenneria tiliae]MCL2898192.1 LysR family transcriptional regulator [Brenneria tiliae]MCL2902542.1 LysR family transcriptional regulator [Brenneria tiliae]
MDIGTLKYFVQVYEDRCLTRSAQKLFISQQALSRQILNLETELGVTLFQRNSRGMAPTEMGDFLYAKALSAINSIAALESDVRTRQRHEHPRYRLGFSPGTLQILGVQRVLAFLAAYQDADCELSEHTDIECEARVDNGSLDMAITVKPGDKPRLSYTSIKQERIVLVSNKKHRLARLAQTRPIRLADMVDVSLIMLDETFRLRETILQHLRRAGVSPRIHTHISHDLYVAYDLVTLNQGVFVFVEGLARPLLRDGMVCIPLLDSGMKWDIGMIVGHESAARSPILLNFVSRFQHEMRQDAETSRQTTGSGCPLFI